MLIQELYATLKESVSTRANAKHNMSANDFMDESAEKS